MFRVVHYLNQFFGQIGGEDHAGIGPQLKDRPLGPGLALQAALGDAAQVVGTVICGDNHIAQNTEQAVDEILALIAPLKPDLLIAGPAFNAGRYGPACGAVCRAVTQRLGIPALTGMYPENPGAEIYRGDVLCLRTGGTAAGMRESIAAMAKLGLRLAAGETLGPREDEGLLPSGVRKNVWLDKTGAARAVDMLLERLAGRPVTTELPMPVFDVVAPAPAVADPARARIALVTEGGLVPTGNPDRLESSRASKYLRYELAGVDTLISRDFQTVHGGYSGVFVNEDPNRLLPVDVFRELVREGRVGSMPDYFYTTTGNGTSLENSRKFGAEIAERLKADGVQGVILTST